MAHTPLGCGALFVTMTDLLKDSGFRLPQYVWFNGDRIPYAYPPLGFYLAGLVSKATGLSVLRLELVLPYAFSILCAGAFATIAYRLLSLPGAAIATIGVILNVSLNEILTGAGISRAPGVFFMLCACSALVSHAIKRSALALIAAGVFAGLALLSHPECGAISVFCLAVYLAVIFAMAPERTPGRAGRYLAVLLLPLLVASPWICHDLRSYGPRVFLYATASSGGLSNLFHLALPLLAGKDASDFVPIIGVLAMMGIFAALLEKKWAYVALAVVACLANRRTLYFQAPVACFLAGYAVDVFLQKVSSPTPREIWRPVTATLIVLFCSGQCFREYHELAYRDFSQIDPGLDSVFARTATYLGKSGKSLAVVSDRDALEEWSTYFVPAHNIAGWFGMEWTPSCVARYAMQQRLNRAKTLTDLNSAFASDGQAYPCALIVDHAYPPEAAASLERSLRASGVRLLADNSSASLWALPAEKKPHGVYARIVATAKVGR